MKSIVDRFDTYSGRNACGGGKADQGSAADSKADTKAQASANRRNSHLALDISCR